MNIHNYEAIRLFPFGNKFSLVKKTVNYFIISLGETQKENFLSERIRTTLRLWNCLPEKLNPPHFHQQEFKSAYLIVL